MPSVKPALRAALVTTLTTALAPIEVHYGYGYGDAPAGKSLMIGAVDPFSQGDDTTDEATQRWTSTGLNALRDEDGVIRCVAMAWTGNVGEAGVKQAYEDAHTVTAAVEASLRSDPTLGGLTGLAWAEFGFDSATREFDDNGPVCLVQFSIHYRARI